MTFERTLTSLIAVVLVAGCGAAEDGAPSSAQVLDASKKDFAESLAQREQQQPDAATLEASELGFLDAARESGIDTQALRARVQAMFEAQESSERERLRQGFLADYGEFLAGLPSAEQPAAPTVDAAAAPDTDVSSTSQEILRPASLTRCSTRTKLPPFEASSPLPPPGESVSGEFWVKKGVSVGAVDERSIFTIRDSIRVDTPAENKVTATATVRIDGGTAEAYVDAPPFGYADSGASLNMRIMDGTREMCSTSLELAHSGYFARNVITPGDRSLKCQFTSARDGVQRYTVEISAGVWASAGGAAHALVDAHGALTRIATETCVEPDRFIDGRGLCVKPFSVPAVDFSQVKIDECRGTADERWRYNASTKQIIHIQSGLCLEAMPPIAAGGFVLMMRCDTLKTTQAWNSRADRQWPSVASPSFCLNGSNGGTPGDRVQTWGCTASGTVIPNRMFRFQ